MRFLVWLLIVAPCASCSAASHQLEIRMPPFDVEKEDTYLCTAVQLNSTRLQLTAVEPHSSQDTVHHMLLFGCEEARYDVPVWDCLHKRLCIDEEVVLYGWGRNAERVQYPEGVGFSIGEGSGIRTLILQVHYLIQRPRDDNSGVVLKLSEEPVKKAASVLEYAADFTIPPQRAKYPVHNECCYSGFEPITTLAFRVHTHEMGRMVSMTKTSGRTPKGSIIAERDPLLPQVTLDRMGFRVRNIFPGETLRVTCDFESLDRTEIVRAGFTHQDEMCNMYMMIYSEIPYFGLCLNHNGFYLDQQTGTMSTDAAFKPEAELSNFWNGPDHAVDVTMGQGVGVDRGPDGKIWFLHRGDRIMDMIERDGQLHAADRDLVSTDPVLILDPTTGETVSSWGADFFSIPHMLTVSPDGDVWITDVGKHQVFKFSANGTLLMTLGQEFVPGSDDRHFCAPTEVAVLTDGSILVSDGYCNKRILKFTPDGRYLDEVQDPELALPHSLVVDECQDLVLVADRDNARVLYYKLTLLTRLGMTRCILAGSGWDGEVYVGGSVMALTQGPYNSALALVKGESDEDHVVLELTLRDRLVPQKLWKLPSASFPHDLTLSAAPVELTGAGDRLFAIYVAETDGLKLSKFILLPNSMTVSLPVERIDRKPRIGDHDAEVGHTTIRQTMKARWEMTFHTESKSPVQISWLNLFLFSYTLLAIALVVCYFRKPHRPRY